MLRDRDCEWNRDSVCRYGLAGFHWVPRCGRCCADTECYLASRWQYIAAVDNTPLLLSTVYCRSPLIAVIIHCALVRCSSSGRVRCTAAPVSRAVSRLSAHLTASCRNSSHAGGESSDRTADWPAKGLISSTSLNVDRPLFNLPRRSCSAAR